VPVTFSLGHPATISIPLSFKQHVDTLDNINAYFVYIHGKMIFFYTFIKQIV